MPPKIEESPSVPMAWRHLWVTLFSQAASGAYIFHLAPVTSRLRELYGISYAEAALSTSYILVAHPVSILLFGYLIDRVGVLRVYRGGAILASLCALLLMGVRNFQHLLWLMFFLGLGTSAMFVASANYISCWGDERRKTFFQGCYGAAFSGGAGLALLASPLALDLFGWLGLYLLPGSFMATGLLFLWTLAKEPPQKRGSERLRPREIWRVWDVRLLLLGFCMFSTWGTFLVLGSWLTEYFLKGQGQVFWASATLSGVAVLLGALGRALGGALTPRGWERRFIGGAFLLSGAAALALASSPGLLLSAALATSAIVSSSFVFAPVLRLTALLTDVRAMGTAFGLILFLGTLLTSLFPPAFGHLLDLTGHFDQSLILMAIIPFIGATAILFVREGPAPPWPRVEARKVL